MKVLNYTQTRDNLSTVIEDVVDNEEIVVITKNTKTAVMISLNEYNSWKETEYLLKSPKNSKRLNHAINKVNKGQYSNRKLLNTND